MNEGIIHVIEQLGIAHKAALGVIEQQQQHIAELEAALAAASESHV